MAAVRDSGGARATSIAVVVPALAAADLAWPLLVAAASLAMAAPLWSSALLPFQDAPQHLAAIRVLADYRSPGFGFARWFEIDLLRLQYLGFYLPAAALAKLFGPDAACRIVLSLILLAFPASLSALLAAFGRDRRLAVFAPAVFHSMPTYMGFFNFVESVPAAIAVVALTEQQLRQPAARRALWLMFGAALLLWLHPSALAFALACAVVLAATSGLPARRMRSALLPYLPSVALFAVWAAKAAASRDGVGHSPQTKLRWLPLEARFLDLIRFGDVLHGHADELFLAAVLVRPRPPAERWFRLPLLAGLTLAAYFAAPFDVGYMGYIEQRALPFLALLLVASPVLSQRRAVSALCAAAVAVQIGYGVLLARSYRAFDREAQVASLERVLRSADPGSSLIALIPDQASAVIEFHPYIHFGSYYEVQRGGRARYNFAETPWTPVRFRRGTEPPGMPLGWEWHPESVSLERDAPADEYVLTRSPAPDPGARYTLRAAAGRWALYERRER